MTNSNTYVLIKHLCEHQGQLVKVRGWVATTRSSGKIHFLVVRDGTGWIQCVFETSKVDEKTLEVFKTLSQESCVLLEGFVKKDARSFFGVEIELSSLTLLSPSVQFPISPKEHGVDFLLSNRHLWLRSKKPFAIMKIRHEFIRASRDFFNSRDFTLVDAPIFTPSACEGTTTLFEVPYFDDGTKAYLSQSGQLYMEACAYAFQKVYSLGPTFRAEKSKTRRHLTEFWMIEPEVLFYTLDDIMKLCEAYLSYCIERVLHECAFEFTLLERDTQKLKNVTPPFPRITYDEAIIQINNLLQKEGSTKVIQWGDDFGAEEESILSKQYTKPLFVYNFPLAIKAFYMKASLDRSDVALGVDCLAPEGYGEIIGGGEREDRYDVLLTKLIEYGIKKDDVTPSDMDWYLDLRKYGSVPHGGFGLGIERALSWITGVEHVRETSPFPRMMYRIKP